VELTVRRRRLLVLLGLLLAAAAVLAVPARSYWAQRGEVAARESALAEVDRTNDDLQARLDHLEDPAEVQRIARRDYGLVSAGEESYSILPPATAGLVLPQGWPFDRISGPLERAATGGT
jgi:cell division protein FtsB